MASMKVLLLSPYPDKLIPALEAAGDSYLTYDSAVPFEVSSNIHPSDIEFIISFGYRNIIKPWACDVYKDRIINLHLSFLPWNRGADPNFWSWFDDSPKGVTIHRIDEGIDTGNIIVQEHIKSWTGTITLKTSYERLMLMAAKLFADNWRNIRRDGLPTRKPEPDVGSYHKKADKDEWFRQLPLGWDTPVGEVRKLGRTFRASQESPKEDRHPGPRKHRQQAFKEL